MSDMSRLKIQMPTVHMNGTSRQTLLDGYLAASDAVERLREAMAGIEFNARDYYVEGPEAWDRALTSRSDAVWMMNSLRDYIDAHLEHLA